MHDKAICDEEQFEFPAGMTIFMDTGFEGFNPENVKVVRPAKKPRGKELTQEQKDENKKISKVRVWIEHTIGDCKIMRIIKDKIRNYKQGFKDLIMQICCGLHNFRLKTKI